MTTDTFNSSVDKYYVGKKRKKKHIIFLTLVLVNKPIKKIKIKAHLFFLGEEKKYYIIDLYFTVKIYR